MRPGMGGGWGEYKKDLKTDKKSNVRGYSHIQGSKGAYESTTLSRRRRWVTW